MRRLAAPEPPSSEITPESLYLRRREFLKNAVLSAGTAAVFGSGLVWLVGQRPPPDVPEQPVLAQAAVAPAVETTGPGPYDTDETMTPYQAVTTYNNFYEFGTDYADGARNAHTLQTRPWTISVEGEVAHPHVIDIDTLLHRSSPVHTTLTRR